MGLCFMGDESQFERMTRIQEMNGGGGCMTACMSLVTPLKIFTVASLMLCVFYHNFFKSQQDPTSMSVSCLCFLPGALLPQFIYMINSLSSSGLDSNIVYQ